MNNIIKVTASTDLLPLAETIARTVRRGQGISLEVSGIAPVNLAVKAIALAHHQLADDGMAVGFVATFVDPEEIGVATPTMHLHVDRPERRFPPSQRLAAPEPPVENEGCSDQQ